MHLDKLEIHGFKSFAEKTKFAFSDGITVIVGPNGSGKSNIADAIRWVLGEQSIKSLRGGKVEDIIFAGTHNRKPLGMAEVSLILNNESGLFPIAYSNVKVTRRVYRSGESEYLINDTPCRLKDIYDLFADSGLGKDALAIVGQGKIDEILSVRAEDRRGIIEEAAGITRYRNRKKEAERKLNSTERDLERISDILSTLGERIEPLTEQKHKAEKYFELDGELKALELQALLHQLTDADTRKQKLFQAINQTKEDKLAKETTIRTLEASLEEKRLQLIKHEEKIATLQQEVFTATNTWEKLQGELKVAEEKVLFIDEKLQDNNLQSVSLRSNLEKLTISKENVTELLQEKEKSSLELSAKLQYLETKKHQKLQQQQEYEKELETLKSAAFDAAQDLSSARNSLSNANKNKDITTHKLLGYENRIQHLKAEIHILEDNYSEQNKEYLKLTEMLAETNCQEEAIKSALQELQHKQSLLSNSIIEKNSQAESAKKQHSFYLEMEHKHEGYGYAVRALLDAKNKEALGQVSIHGTVGDVIKVENKYETAIEIALGAAIQNIIVDTEQDASKAIAFLKQNNQGRATFLPIAVIKGEKAKLTAQHLIASDLVMTDSRYRNIITALLGRTLIAENLKMAIAVARETGHRYKIVTLEGDVISPGGSMSGGSTPKKQTSFLARKRIIEELSAKVEGLHSELIVIRNQAQHTLEELKSQENTLSQLLSEKQAMLDVISNKDKENALLQQQIASLNKEVSEHTLQYDFLKNEEQSFLSEIAKENTLVENKQEYYQEITNKIEVLNETVRNTRLDSDTDNNDLLQINTSLARLDEEIKARRQELKTLAAEIVDKNEQVLKLTQEKDRLATEREEKNTFITEINCDLNLSADKRGQYENLLQTAKENKQREQMQVFEEEQKLKLLQKQLAGLFEDIHAKEIRLAKLEAETEGLEERLIQEYSTTFDEAVQNLLPEFNKRTATERIKFLQVEIAALGNINLDAIEEHKQVTERFTFLATQKEDLKEAKDSLFKVIQEIEKEMSLKFIETFKLVNHEFQNIFQKIFNGGTAKLLLTDEANALESGIDIIAQPPGKKLQHLMLLSGGEKALTAIALLFAVLRIKPAPFCVLDEIEAALDEANVERFAAFLKDYSSKTQFIIISHRQGTMEVADTLYGTTMEEQGVTKLISVKFDDRMVG